MVFLSSNKEMKTLKGTGRDEEREGKERKERRKERKGIERSGIQGRKKKVREKKRRCLVCYQEGNFLSPGYRYP